MNVPSAAMATPCPSCGQAMATQRLERRPHGESSIDTCAGCRVLWFDGFESVQLTPGATLALLKTIHEAEHENAQPLGARLPCPRCSAALALTSDLQRTTRFSYFRCPRGHGRLTPFVQFLLEKSFVRPLPPLERERLRASVGTVRCNGCGAAIDLAKDAACRYCRAPVAVLDPDALAQTVASLSAAETKRHRIDPAAMADALTEAERFNHSLASPSLSGTADAILDAIQLGATALDILFSSRR
jgi:ssDNA-binding Zn-finger/Zn-ribbon topoisomerase 1